MKMNYLQILKFDHENFSSVRNGGFLKLEKDLILLCHPVVLIRVETTLHFILFSREIRKNLLFPTKSSKICWPVLAILHLL